VTVIEGPLRFASGCAGKSRLSSQRLQHPLFLDSLQAPLQKIDFHSLLPDFALQLCHFGLIPAPLSHTGKRVAGAMAKFLPPPMQQIRVDFKGAGHLGGRRPHLQLPNRSQLHFFRELPSRQSHESILHSMIFDS